MVEKSSEVFVHIPRVFTPAWKVEITRSSGTTDDVTDDLIYLEFDKPVTEGVGQFKLTLDNNRDTYTELYDGGETTKIYLDMVSATTEKFEGTIEHIKRVEGDYGHTLDISGIHVAGELVDITIVASYDNLAISDTTDDGTDSTHAILQQLIYNFAPSGFTKTNIANCTTTATVNWEHQSFWSAIQDLCVLAGYDCYVDDDKDFHFFEQNSNESTTEAVVWGPTLLETDGLGEDITDVKNKVIVYGEDDQGMPIIYTAEDSSSQSSYNTKEKIIKDSSISTMTEAEERGDAELGELKDPVVRGTARCMGMPTLNPGDLIWVSVPPLGLHNKYRVLKFTHIIDMGEFTTEVELSKPTKGFSYEFKKQTKMDLVTRTILNPNKLDYSYNFTFDDDSNIATHSNTETSEGKLILSSGQTSGTMTTNAKVAAKNITQVELKFIGSNLDNSAFEVSVNNGVEYETITRDELLTVGYVGNDLKLKASLATTGTTRPEIDSLAILYK